MKVLIIEDERHTANRLKQIIKDYDSNIEIPAILSSVAESIDWFQNNSLPDLIFQDIRLSDGNCFDIYESQSINVPVIFTTAFSEYALRAFNVNSIDYLVKPYDFTDIKRALDKFKKIKLFFNLQDIPLLKELIISKSASYRKRFLVRSGDNYKSVPASEVAYIFSEDSISFIYTNEGKKHFVDQSILQLKEELDPHHFFQVNRKYIVGMQSIQKISNWYTGRLKLELNPGCENEVTVSRERVKLFKQWLNS